MTELLCDLAAICNEFQNEAACILNTFPIVREHDLKEFGRYRTAEDILANL
jgi:hypothetical protein